MTQREAAGPAATRRTAGLVLAAVAAALTLDACGTDAICGGGQYPVQAIGGTGRQCVPDGQSPPAGFTRYPAGKTPAHVDDKWDVYWRSHMIDEHGNIVDAR